MHVIDTAMIRPTIWRVKLQLDREGGMVSLRLHLWSICFFMPGATHTASNHDRMTDEAADGGDDCHVSESLREAMIVNNE